jgi:MFS family permease
LGYLFKATSINIARAIYALNWFDIAPGLIYISNDLGLKFVQLGIATTFFYLGLGPFQFVGGALASRIGSRKVAFIGLLLLGIGAIYSAYSFNLLELAFARFIAGCGSAFFFSPGLSILRDISPPESFGFQVGIYNGAFSLGGGVGAFGWVFVDRAIGWQSGLVLGGVMMIAIAIENFIVLRGGKEVLAETTGFATKMLSIVKNKFLWMLAIGTIVSTFVETIGGQFLVYFGENYLKMSPSESGFIDGLFLIIGFVGGLVGGYFLSNPTRRRPFTYLMLVMSGLAFMIIPFSKSFILLTFDVAVAGFSVVSGFSALYVFATPHARDKAMVPFALSFVNFIGIAIGSISPFTFTLLTDKIGPAYGWVILGAIGIALVPLLLMAKNPEGVNT